MKTTLESSFKAYDFFILFSNWKPNALLIFSRAKTVIDYSLLYLI